jgi:hypothetical protein
VPIPLVRLLLSFSAESCLSTAGGYWISMSDQIASTMACAAANATVVGSRGATTRFSQV